MTEVTREQVYQAVWALRTLVQWDIHTPVPPDDPGYSTLVSSDRRVKLFSDVDSLQKPFVCQAEHGETIAQKTNMPYRRIFECSWIVYQDSGLNKSVAGAILNNKILDAVQAAFAPRPTDIGFRDKRNTLGGLVYHCFLEGSIFKDPGDIDDQGMMVIPIKILVP